MFPDAAAELGRLMAARNYRLVYGGGHVGLMGVLADAVLANGGEVLGAITRALEAKEITHQGLSELRVVDTMHERKAAMADAADAFVMLPGGYGTWEEFFEALTWTQLGVHLKPCGILDVAGFFAPLRDFIDHATNERFIRPEHCDLLRISDNGPELLDWLETWQPVIVDKWIDRSQR